VSEFLFFHAISTHFSKQNNATVDHAMKKSVSQVILADSRQPKFAGIQWAFTNWEVFIFIYKLISSSGLPKRFVRDVTTV